MGLFGGKSQDEPLAEAEERLRLSESEGAALKARLQDMGELIRHLDEDRDLLLGALERLKPGLDARALAEALFETCFKPFGLACFYVALAEWEEDQLRFVFYHEGGRARNHPSRKLSSRAGLSEKVLDSGRALYIRTMEEGEAAGSFLTAAEQATGLIPNSWYGVPLAVSGRPFGLVSFQSFQTDAFTEDRRRIMDALAGLLSICLCPLAPPKITPAESGPAGGPATP